VGNTAGKSMYEMKEGDHVVLWTCKCKVARPNHGNPQQVDTSPRSKRREEPFSDLLTFSQQSARCSGRG
jgi:hypothetical protein